MLEIRDIHEPFIAWLDKNCIPFHRNRSDKKTTATEGDPDFLVTSMGHCVYIECKVPGRALTHVQRERIAYIRAAENKVVIAYSLEMCIEACTDMFSVKNLSVPVQAEEAIAEANGPEAGGSTTRRPTPLCGVAEKLAIDGHPPGAQSLFIAQIAGVNYVCSGDRTPGGTIKRIRIATAGDVLNMD